MEPASGVAPDSLPYQGSGGTRRAGKGLSEWGRTTDLSLRRAALCPLSYGEGVNERGLFWRKSLGY